MMADRQSCLMISAIPACSAERHTEVVLIEQFLNETIGSSVSTGQLWSLRSNQQDIIGICLNRAC